MAERRGPMYPAAHTCSLSNLVTLIFSASCECAQVHLPYMHTYTCIYTHVRAHTHVSVYKHTKGRKGKGARCSGKGVKGIGKAISRRGKAVAEEKP